MDENSRLILGLICAIIFIIKMLLHRYLDKKNNYLDKYFLGIGNLLFAFPYYNQVSHQ